MLRLFTLACILSTAITAHAQFIDSGSADAPTPRPKSVAPPTTRTASQEQLLRRLITFKSQRDQAIADKDDPRIKDLNSQIAAIHVLLDIADGTYTANNATDNAPPVYPRIVQTPPPDTSFTPSYSADSASIFAPPPDAKPAPDDALNEATRAYLHQTLATTVADHVGIEKTLNFLQSQTRKSFFINWKALEAAGIARETPVSVNLVEVPVDATLDTLLKSASSNNNLAFTIDAGIITISTAEDLNSAKYQSFRMYDVADLIATPESQLPFEQSVEIHNYRAAQVMDLIRVIVATDSWRDNGGSIGSIREFDNVLIINQTEENHRAIARCLAQFRQVRGQ